MQNSKVTHPYISISAIQNCSETRAVMSAFKSLRDRLPAAPYHLACIGFAVDQATLDVSLPQSRRKVDSLDELLKSILLLSEGRFLPAVHFDLGIPTSLHASFHELINLCVPALQPLQLLLSRLPPTPYLLQLNGVVTASNIEQIRSNFPHVKIIYAISPHLLQLSSATLGDHIQELVPNVDYWLYDPSGGTGHVTTADAFQACAQLILRHAPHALIGISGGLNPDNVAASIESATSIVPRERLCIDVESGVRCHTAADRIDVRRVERFILESMRALAS